MEQQGKIEKYRGKDWVRINLCLKIKKLTCKSYDTNGANSLLMLREVAVLSSNQLRESGVILKIGGRGGLKCHIERLQSR